MIVKNITYNDFNGSSRNEPFYFNLTEAELFELEFGTKGGLVAYLKEISSTQNGVEMMKFAKSLLLKSYGKKTPDGRGFMKSDEIRAEFESTNAFSQLFIKFLTDSEWAIEFLLGIIPSDMSGKVREQMASNPDALSLTVDAETI